MENACPENQIKQKKRLPLIFRLLTVLLSFLLLWGLLQQLLLPKYQSELREGAMIAEYYKDKSTHDVVFVGDCEVYESYSPVTLWQEYGITSWIRGSAQQLIWQSYYLMEDTLRHENPKAFVFNIQSLQYGEPQKEEYNRMTLDGMQWSPIKWKAIRASMCKDETMSSYLFPILRYHERIFSLNGEDVRYLFSRPGVTHNGYLMNVGVDPYKGSAFPIPLPDYRFSQNALDYLDRMVSLCQSHGVQLIFVKAPSIAVVWYDEWEQQVEDYAAEKGIPYYNFLKLTEEVGLDFSVDTYDHGQHLNLYGAEKLSLYFGKILRERFSVPDHREDAGLSELWEEKRKHYENEKAQLMNDAATT